MGRISRILFWALFFLFVYLGMVWLAVGCGDDTQDIAQDAIEATDEAVQDLEENAEKIVDEFFEDGDGDDATEIVYSREDDDDITDEIFPDAKEEEKAEEPKPVQSAPVRSTASSSGRYLVVAGNYLVESNAKTMVDKLKRMGFGGSDYLVFDQSQYYTVIASRSTSRSAAQSSSDNLKGKGVDNYVHTQRD